MKEGEAGQVEWEARRVAKRSALGLLRIHNRKSNPNPTSGPNPNPNPNPDSDSNPKPNPNANPDPNLNPHPNSIRFLRIREEELMKELAEVRSQITSAEGALGEMRHAITARGTGRVWLWRRERSGR